MSKDIYSKLVDLYAGDELNEELKAELEARAQDDSEISQDMHSLRGTLLLLQQSGKAGLTEESSQRILMKMRTQGAQIEQNSPDPSHLQYHLPIQG